MYTNDQKMQITERLKGLRTAMMVTRRADGTLHSRPMATQEVEFDGDIWFVTSKDSLKVDEVKKDDQVNLAYGDGGVRFVSISGTVDLVEDKQKVHELWNDMYKAWFENENDPRIQLLKVAVERFEYWDYTGGKLGAYVDMLKSAITGEEMDHDEHGAMKV